MTYVNFISLIELSIRIEFCITRYVPSANRTHPREIYLCCVSCFKSKGDK